MTRRKLSFIFVCFAVGLAVTYGSETTVQGVQKELAAENAQGVDLNNKIVVLEIIGESGLGSESHAMILANARVLKLGNRDFIVGDAVSLLEDDQWHKEITAGAPCDNIMKLRTMTPDRFKTYAKIWGEQAEE